MKMRDTSAVISGVEPNCDMTMPVAPFSRTSPVAVMNERATWSQGTSLLYWSAM